MTVQLGICQDGYPKRVEIDGQELILFTPQQARKLDVFRVQLKHSTELVKDLQKRLKDCDDLLEHKNSFISKQKNQIGNYELLSETNDSIIIEKNEEIKELTKRLNKKSFSSKLYGVGLGISIAVIGILLVK